MARDGNGAYSLTPGEPVVTETLISSTTHNTTMADVAAALTQSVSKDGQTTYVANQSMGGFKHTAVAVGTARDQYSAVSQVQDGTLTLIGSVSGTDAITGSLSPAITAYPQGSALILIPQNDNTTAATLSLNGLTAKPLVKGNALPLIATDLRAGVPVVVVYNGTSFTVVSGSSVQDAVFSTLTVSGAATFAGAANMATINGVAPSDFARLSQSNSFLGASQSFGTVALPSAVAQVLSSGSGKATLQVNASGSEAAEFTANFSGATDVYGIVSGHVGIATVGGAPIDIKTAGVINLITTSARVNGSPIWTAANMGSTSGLNADLTDGYHASESAASLTLAARTNAGYLYSTYFNQSSPSTENPSVGAIFVETGNDGFHRKASPAHLISQLSLVTQTAGTLIGRGFQNTAGSGYIQDGVYIGFNNGGGAGSLTRLYGGGSTTSNVTVDASGNLVATGDVSGTSDRRLKDDLVVIDSALEKLCALTGYTYLRTDLNVMQAGLIAQDVQAVLPEAVKEDERKYLNISHGAVLGLIVEAIKELREQVRALS
jgi:hypothetical protein